MIEEMMGLYKRNERLIKDNITLAIGLLAFGLAGYIFHFYAGRKLGPEEYGVLGALLSILYLVNILTLFVQLAITKAVSNFKEKKEEGKISYLLKQGSKKYWVYGIASALIIAAMTPLLRYYLGIKVWIPFFAIALMMLFSYILSFNIGVLQGLQRFKGLAIVYWGQGITKVGMGILLMGIGLGATGGMTAFATSYLIAWIISIILITKVSTSGDGKTHDNILKKSIPLLVVLGSLSLMYSVDVILVKHYLQTAEAGYYTALSTLGKVIFFASNSVSFVMFPKISETKTRKENRSILYKSIMLIILITLPITLGYALFPSLVVNLLFGQSYMAIKGLLFMFGMVMLLYSIIYTICFYNLSLNKTKFIYILLLSNVTQITALIIFNKNIEQVTYVMLGFMTTLLLSLLVIKERKHETPLADNTSIQ
ncbi:MAG: oligosaccharide flippase family protein [archaeon]